MVGLNWYLATFVAASTLALILTRTMRNLAVARGWVDVPDGGRRRHLQPTPRGGGVPLVISVALTLLLIALLAPSHVLDLGLEANVEFTAMALGGVAILLLGFWDDVVQLQARTKFLFEVAVAVALFAAGVRIDVLNVLGGSFRFGDATSLLLTVLWIVGVTNAFNLIDGSDGVAAGAALFASLTMAFVALTSGSPLGAIIALAIAGATLGFLFFNFPPASIFLGDSGSLFLGYSLAVLGIGTAQKASTMLAVAIPVVSCGLPIIDVALTVMRRFLRRQPLFGADRGHIHHRLQDLGHSPRSIALVLMAVSASFALLSILLVHPMGDSVAVAFVIAGIVTCVAIQRLRIPEILELQRVFDRGLRQRRVIAQNMRLRECIGMLDGAATIPELESALHHGFDNGDFEAVELVWLSDGGRAPIQLRVKRNGHMHDSVLTLQRPSPNGRGAKPSSAWEICLPFRDPTGVVVGSLTLWAAPSSGHVLTDLGLIARDLQPAVRTAFERVYASPEPGRPITAIPLRAGT